MRDNVTVVLQAVLSYKSEQMKLSLELYRALDRNKCKRGGRGHRERCWTTSSNGRVVPVVPTTTICPRTQSSISNSQSLAVQAVRQHCMVRILFLIIDHMLVCAAEYAKKTLDWSNFEL